MEDRSKEGQGKQQVAGHPVSEHFDQIDPHRRDQPAPAPNRPDRVDENLNGAKRHGDPIPEDGATVDPALTLQRPNPGKSAAGGFPAEGAFKKK